MRRLRYAAPVLVLAAIVAACGGTVPSSGVTTSPVAQTPTDASTDPTGTAPPATPDSATEPPPATEPPVETEPPAETEPAESEEPLESLPPGGAAACTGNDDNRAFLEDFAAQVDWTVLCAVLPRRWFVDKGSYRLAGGGRLLMSYQGPGGATLALSEGAFCREAGGCVPPGTDAGDAALGPMTGTLVALDDGGWAIVVDRGEAVSWLLEARGVDEQATRSLGAALTEVAG